ERDGVLPVIVCCLDGDGSGGGAVVGAERNALARGLEQAVSVQIPGERERAALGVGAGRGERDSRAFGERVRLAAGYGRRLVRRRVDEERDLGKARAALSVG